MTKRKDGLVIEIEPEEEEEQEEEEGDDEEETEIEVSLPSLSYTPFDMVDDRTMMGYPGQNLLQKINQYRPRGTMPYSSDQVVTVPFMASDNLISFSQGAWDTASLQSMVQKFPGKIFTLNHDWDDARTAQGRIYDAWLETDWQPSDEVLGTGENYEWNKKIVERDGWIKMCVAAFFESNSPAVSGFRFGRLGEVSTGGFTNGDFVCPLCDTSFDDKHCDHYPPHPMIMWMYGDIDPALLAPYYIRTGFHTAIEVSAVPAQNLPMAGILRGE